MSDKRAIDFRKSEDDTATFTLVHDDEEMQLVIMVTEVAGYPTSHTLSCFTESENVDHIQAAEEVALFVPLFSSLFHY